MRYAVLGDIHSNLTALETVLAAIAKEGADHIISVGDIVGYGGAPREAIQIVREIGATVVKGNHDAACIGEVDIQYFNPYAREAIEWTMSQLSAADLSWLRELPLTAHFPDCSVSHGTLAEPESYEYIQSLEDADPSLDSLATPICFLGHTHVPVAIMRLADSPNQTAYTTQPEIDLSEVSRTLLNVGSVGQPRDEDERAAYAIYDSSANMAWIRRVTYDIDREAARIHAAGLPRMLADRLFLGV